MIVIPAFMAAVVWLMGAKLPQPIRILIAWLVGIALPVCFGWSIYRNEGGNEDPDPWTFLVSISFASAFVALATILILEWRKKPS